MRSFAIVALLFAVSSGIFAGEDLKADAPRARVQLLGGVYSVEAPETWWVQEEVDRSAVTFAPSKESSLRVVFSVPNPTIKGELESYVGTQLGLMFEAAGGGDILEEKQDTFKGYRNIMIKYVVAAGENGSGGVINAIDVNGSAVMCISFAPVEVMDEFLPLAASIIDSYEVNVDALNANMELLTQLGIEANSRIAENLAKPGNQGLAW